MKTAFVPLLLACCLTAASANDTLKETGEWHFAHPVYGQLRAVANPSALDAEPVDWVGPWSQLDTFNILFSYQEGTQLSPGHFKYVMPEIELHGTKQGEDASYGFTVPLFDGASTANDIKFILYPIKGEPKTNTEYKVATVYSNLEKTRWDIFVRFVEEKPAYVR